MKAYDAALRRLMKKTKATVSIGAESLDGRSLGQQAVAKFLTVENHEPWLFWAIRSDGSTVAKAGDKESDVADPFGYLGMESTPYGDLSKVSYAAYWDVTKNPIKASDEYAGDITITPTAEPKKEPVAAAPTKKGHGLWWLLGGIAGLGAVIVAKKKG